MHEKLDENAERYDDVSGGELRRGLDAEQMIWPQTLLCLWVLVHPRPSSALCSRSFLLILIFPALPSSTAWSIYITDLFILFQDNFHHCSKCIWKERPACHVAADIRKQGKKILHSLQMFFPSWPVGLLLHLTSTKCQIKGEWLKINDL